MFSSLAQSEDVPDGLKIEVLVFVIQTTSCGDSRQSLEIVK